jgi:hypothetical protein
MISIFNFKVTCDLDISNLEPGQLNAYQYSIASGQQVVKIGDNQYPISSIDLQDYNMFHHIISLKINEKKF